MPDGIKSGIYCIRHQNGRVYVGSARDLKKRKQQHFKMLRDGKHHSIKLQRAWEKYGESEFTFDVMETITDPLTLIIREQFWIDKLNACHQTKGFNVQPKAGSPLGLKRTAESRMKMHLAHTGKKRGPMSEATRENIRIALLGKTHTPEARARMSASKAGIPRGSPSQETKDKIRNTLTGQKYPVERCMKSGATRKGKKVDPALAARRHIASLASRLRNKQIRLEAIQPSLL